MIKKGSFVRHKRSKVSYADEPTSRDRVWIDPSTGVQFTHDGERNVWLSTAKYNLEFARKGNASGMYLPLLGDLYDTDDVYLLPYNATIIGIWCRSKSGEKSKAFDVRVNKETVFSFSYDGSNKLIYINNDLNIPIAYEDEVNIFVSKSLSKVNNTVCKIELARRYCI